MLPKDEFLTTYQKKLNQAIETQSAYILSGPSTDFSTDEVSLEYVKRLGELEGLKKAYAIFEDTATAYFGK